MLHSYPTPHLLPASRPHLPGAMPWSRHAALLPYAPPAGGQVVKVLLLHYLLPYAPPAGGQVVKAYLLLKSHLSSLLPAHHVTGLQVTTPPPPHLHLQVSSLRVQPGEGYLQYSAPPSTHSSSCQAQAAWPVSWPALCDSNKHWKL